MMYQAVTDPDWRVAEGSYGCLTHGPATDGLMCGKPAAAEKHRPNDRIRPWGAYCAEHAQRQGAWVEDGEVLKWELLHTDGTPLTEGEAARVRALLSRARGDECKKHRCPQDECPPESSHPKSLRFRKDLWDDIETAAAEDRTHVAGWVRRATETLLEELCCPKCPDTAPPVPVTFGDLAGRPLRGWVADAVRQVKAQHPRHEPVMIGAESRTTAARKDG